MKTMRVQWKLRKVGDGYEGTIVLPCTFGQMMRAVPVPPTLSPQLQQRMMVAKQRVAASPAAAQPVQMRAAGLTPASALGKAAGMAGKLLGNPLVQAAMPPGTGAAVKGIQLAAKIASSKGVKKAMKAVVGPGAKRLFGALKGLF